jgi:hypothetical protein
MYNEEKAAELAAITNRPGDPKENKNNSLLGYMTSNKNIESRLKETRAVLEEILEIIFNPDNRPSDGEADKMSTERDMPITIIEILNNQLTNSHYILDDIATSLKTIKNFLK